MRCPSHPQDPLQFFCLRCETSCICAECALHGDHRGHDVLNVREAVGRISGKTMELGLAVQTRREELVKMVEHAKEGSKDLATIGDHGRRDFKSAMETVKKGLEEEEAALLAEVDRCTADVAEILTIKDEPSEVKVRECLNMLRQHHKSADHAQALNWFSKSRKANEDPAPARRPGGDELHAQLRSQLQRGFEARLDGISALASQVAKLSPIRVHAAEAHRDGAASALPKVIGVRGAATLSDRRL
eukprot:TRINITY_DN39613_c0_g1_i2.p2 TRINITY_DN39613_c0_g1~~TRINITY_DN39613_c0_g1_i2.p2  ORF type:complete len:245 (-),score=46.39 TRINITY_DN39613_c0_g1_i2:62-796(-)